MGGWIFFIDAMREICVLFAPVLTTNVFLMWKSLHGEREDRNKTGNRIINEQKYRSFEC